MGDFRQDDEDYRKEMARYSVSCMSNARWVKLLTAVARSGIRIERAQWQYINDGACFCQTMPSEDDLMPTRFADGRFQPWEYKWIEWVFIPNEFAPVKGVGYRIKQDTRGLLDVICGVGKFDIEETQDGIRLYAYRP